MTANKPEFLFVGMYEVREFPKGWEHPKDATGRYVPLLPADEPLEEGDDSPKMPATWNEHETEIAAYETTTEGTPISPAFPATADGRLALLRYCAEHCTTFGKHKADAEAWAAILFGDAAVAADGRVVAEG